ncbi:odorant receptor 74a-like [Musca domestica]|uniref:Odorant receptor 74a-like n=2 Tax=Musca domestica TaxID=7370 RepID=A0A9J7CYQ0_MUSDO|nr:odorant receptor 74a-like [Musca domestica]
MLYTPRLVNGRPVALTWPMTFYRRFNIICWPLEDNAVWWTHIFTTVIYMVSFLIFVMHNDAEVRYLRVNFHNLDDMLTGIPTYFVLIEIHIRAFTSAFEKKSFKWMLRKFYAEIFIEESLRPDIHAGNLRSYYPVLAFSILYLCALLSYIVFTIYGLAVGEKPLPYKMIPPFDYNSWYIYTPLVLSSLWVGFIVASTIVGESYALTMFVHNLDGRYQMMGERLNMGVENILKFSSNDSEAIEKFHRILIATLKENIRLNKFAQEIQREFSFRIFIIFSFLAATLCVLVFKVYTSPVNSIPYVFWTIGKVQETIAFGQIGTTIISRTDALSSMYYESKWEAVIQHSSNAKANVSFFVLCRYFKVLAHILHFSYRYVEDDSMD